MHQSPVPDQDVTSARCVSHDIAAAFRNLGFEKGSQYSLRVFGPNVVSLVRFEGGQDFLSGDLRPSMRTWDVLEWSRIRADVIERDPGSRIEVADMFGIEIGVLVPIAFSASPTCEIEMDACWFADQGLEQFSQRSRRRSSELLCGACRGPGRASHLACPCYVSTSASRTCSSPSLP